jgi:pimeloyl-ACP methyl ester carboxylesterase
MTGWGSNTRWSGPSGWSFHRWGTQGRPVLFINDGTVDPSAWWPLAARLADRHRAVVVQPPAAEATGCVEDLDTLAGDLAVAVAKSSSLAPVVVGYSTAALTASLFGARYAAYAVVNVEQPLDHGADSCPLRTRATPPTATGHCPRRRPGVPTCPLSVPDDGTPTALASALRSIRIPYLSVFATLPSPGYPQWLGSVMPTSHVIAYGTPGHVPHSTDPDRFVADIRRLAR